MNIYVPVFECPTCEVPAVLRWSLSLTGGGAELLYQRDCKHRTQLRPRAAMVDVERFTEVNVGAGTEPVRCATVRFVVPDDCVDVADLGEALRGITALHGAVRDELGPS